MEVCHDEYSSVQRLLSIKRSSVMGLLMELPHRAKFEGRITGIQGSERTSLRVISHFGETATQELDADGSFSFPGIGFSLGLATLELKEGPWCFKATRSRWHSVHLRDEDKQHRFAAMSSSVLAGTVLDDRGNPVSGVRVAVPLKRYGSLGLLGSRRQVLTVTDGEGRYRIRGMSPGEVGVWLLGRGFADQQLAVKVESAVRGASADQPSTAKVYRPAAIEGRVTRGGQPVWGALVMVNRGIYGTRKTRTNKDGSYFLGGLPPGEHALRVRFGVLPIEHLPRPVEVKPGQVVRGVDCDLPSRRIKGRLVDLTETPMPNLLVETPSGVAVATDEDGEFELDIQRAKVWLNVRLREGEPVIQRFPVAVRAREVDVVVRIAPRARLRAKMICLPSDESARGVVVRLEPPPQPAGQRQQSEEFAKKYLPNALQGAWSTLDKNFSRWNRYERKVVERWLDLEDGVIDMSNLPNREVLLTIRAKGYLPYVAVVKLSNSSLKDLGVVKLRRGSRVYGVVVDHVGKPLEGARVVVGRESELANRAAKTAYVTDARGRFMARGISLANRRLYVAADGYATRAYDLKLPRDSLRRRGSPVRIQMQTGATIEVQVENKWGLPLGYMMVRLHRAGELIANGRTDEQGRVAFTHLAKDDYRISVQGRPRSQIGLSVVSTGGNKSYRRRIVLKD